MSTRDDDDGALAIIVALFAVMLFILSALIVEAGTQRESRRDAQNAADAGALAAVAVLAESGTRRDAVTAAAEYGVANNFPSGRTEANYFDGCTATVPSGWQRSGRTSCVSFEPDDTQPGKWSAVQVTTPEVQTPRLFGAVVAPTRALARASIQPGADTRPPVIFAGSPSCLDTVQWATTITGINAMGDIHSNNNLTVGGGTVTGDGTYRGSLSFGPTATTWTPNVNNPTDVGADEDAPRAYPKVYNIDDFRLGGSWRAFAFRDAGATLIDRTWLSTNPPAPMTPYLNGNILRRGIYYTTGDITIDGTLTSSGATFVSDGGTITFNGTGTKTLRSYAGDLQAFSTKVDDGSCGTDGVVVADTARVTFSGVIYSPDARIRVSDAARLQTPGTTRTGSLEGWTVQGFDTSRLILRELTTTVVADPTLHLSK